jgi:MoaA/NifB/PqqE/SkfB family radical SAM enzyme
MTKLDYYFEMGRAASPKMLPMAANYLKYKLIKPKAVVTCYTPQIVGLMMTNKCNLRCSYCAFARDGVLDEKKSEMTIGIVKSMFPHPLLNNAVLFDLIGGEPLLCSDLIEIVAFLAGRGHLTNIVTNGISLADKISGLKKAEIARINVSIYPENIKVLRETLKGINSIFRVHTSYVLTRSQLEKNAQEIMEIVEMTKSSGCKSMRFWMFRPLGKNPDLSEVVTNDLPAYNSFFLRLQNKYKNYILWPSVFNTSKEEEIDHKKCLQPWQRIDINAKGEVFSCCGNFGNLPCIPNVNIFTSTANEVYNNPFMTELRKNLLDKSMPAPAFCQTCDLLNKAGW